MRLCKGGNMSAPPLDQETGVRAFRSARLDDLAAVRALTEAAYASYVPILGDWPAPVEEDYVPRIESGQVHLVEVDRTMVGLLVLERHFDHAAIYSVAIRPDRQGEGHGLALLRLAENTTRSWSLGELRLYTNARMERNLSLYARLGYRETGRRSHPKRSGFVIVDMAYTIAPHSVDVDLQDSHRCSDAH